ncbi:MAG: cytochrome c [Polyangiaceae bacterium]
MELRSLRLSTKLHAVLLGTAVFATGLALSATGCTKASGTTTDGGDDEPLDEEDAGARVNDGGAVASDAPVGTDVPLQLYPPVAYTGFDGTHAFQVPVVVYGSATALVRASDPSAVDVVPATRTSANPGTGSYFLVTAKKAGEFRLTAYEPSGGTNTASSQLVITPYAAGRWATGEQRYKNDASSGAACLSCHAPGKVDHSPARIAPVADDQVVTVITAGILVSGNPITQVDHRWAVSDSEADGLVTYLRALAPNGYTKR